MFSGIDLFSDTLTQPSQAMRKAIAEAVVGDEQKGEDPTTLALETFAAEILGHSAAIFLPSATLANQIAIQTHCDRGDEIVAAHNSHVLIAEAGGPAVHSGVMAKPITTENGIFDGETLRKAFRQAKGPLYPVTKLVALENTTNMGGGIAWPRETLQSVLSVARELGMKTHLDGARLFNAAAASGMSPKEIASPFHTVTLCLSKGLGCPAGALLAYPKDFFPKVRRLKQLMGGSLRQSGILAAAGLYALKNNIVRLAEDHANAKTLAQGLSGIRYLDVENPSPSTNMVFFRWKHPTVSGEEFGQRIQERGVRFSFEPPGRFRAVTHLDISKSDIENTIRIVQSLTKEV